ncbi:hypothetical protein BH09BAC1_BH09BAC1_15000 [soil metagenome]
MEPQQSPDEELDLKTQNELTKLQLTLEHGVTFSEPDAAADVPAEVEFDFLNHIQEYEKQAALRRNIIIYDFLGQPAYRLLSDLGPHEVKTELDKIQEIMAQNEVFLDTLNPVSDEELYRFITEELFQHETGYIRIPGMMHCFTYEEFRPENNEYDIKRYAEEFFEDLFKFKVGELKLNPIWLHLASEVEVGSEKYNYNTVTAFLLNFLNAYDSLKVITYKQQNLAIDNGSAVVDFDIAYEAISNKETLQLSSTGRFYFKLIDQYWDIVKIDAPSMGF